MEKERRRIEDDLRGMIRGDVACDPIRTLLFASDASVYQIAPLAVVRPRSIADIQATIEYAGAHDLSVHPRGAGSGVAGESLGAGIILDLTRYMRRIHIRADAATVTADAGATLADVNRSLRRHGRWIGPDPITRSITTIGSVVARDAAGSHYLRSGSARDAIRGVRFVTADGRLVDASKQRLSHARQLSGQIGAEDSQPDDPAEVDRLSAGIAEIHSRFQDRLQNALAPPPFRLDDTVDRKTGVVDLAKFMVGTQGTLGVFCSATLDTEPIPSHRGVVLAFYHRLDMAVAGAIEALKFGVVASDWMDRRLLQIARETDPEFRQLLPVAAEAMLLVEIQGESLGDLYDRLAIIRDALSRGPNGAFESVDTTDQTRRDRFWALSRRVIPRLYRLKTDAAPRAFVEDIRLPQENLMPAIADLQSLLRQHDTAATMFGQLGRGSLHIRPFLELSSADGRKRLSRLSREIASVVWRHGGVISAEHAAGLSKSHLMPQQYAELWPAMGQIKRLFDPQHRLNPGKLFGALLQRVNENLRPSDRKIEIVEGDRTIEEADELAVDRSKYSAAFPTLPVLQYWPPGNEISAAARLCNGCGRCRTTAQSERQCPVFRALPIEEATPRAKANLLRGVVSGQLPVSSLSEDAAKSIADLCFNCHQCRVECPASVDIPKIVGELKAQYVAGNGQTLSDFLMARIDSVAKWASRFPRISNRLMRSPSARWLAERTFGLTAARELPPIASETFLRHATRRRWTKQQPHGGLKVCYFVDHFANHHDPDIGRAIAEVLQQNEIGFYVPPSQLPSGMARITMGDLAAARKVARRNVRLLVDAVRAGYTIVASEPAAALCLTHEYPNLLGNEDALLVAEHTQEITQYLWRLHEGKRLSTQFDAIHHSVAYHQPCHLRVMDPDRRTVSLLGLIPGLEIQDIEAGCTGMAGTWGLQRRNYRSSLRIGWPMISAMRGAKVSFAVTNCGACKMQIEHGAGRSTMHPIKLLAHAYGRMPKIATELESMETP